MLDLKRECKSRRDKLLTKMGEDSVTVIFAAKEKIRNGDAFYTYRQESDFYYLTGIKEPNFIAVFVPGRKDGQYILFCLESSASDLLWRGKKDTLDKVAAEYGADQVFPLAAAENIIPSLFLDKKICYFDIKCQDFGGKIITLLQKAYEMSRRFQSVPDVFMDVRKITSEMRIQKSYYEIAMLKKAASISCAAHLSAMRFCKSGLYEYQIAAELKYTYMANFGGAESFPVIVASGANACVLHYVDKRTMLKDGDLVLIDSGVEYESYASDITRTMPIGRKFSGEQRAIYEAVLIAQLKVISKVQQGAVWNELEDVAAISIAESLLELGILRGSLDEVMEKNAYKQFYMHSIGHWLGLDVHDVGRYKLNGKWRTLLPGMCFTIEPGIYISEGSENVAARWHGIGVRIEDDILVTEEGALVLTSDLPKSVADIEGIGVGF